MNVRVKALGPLAEKISNNGDAVDLPDTSTLGDLLGMLGIAPSDVMLAFVDGALAVPSTPLRPGCRVYLSPFICGG